MFTPIPFYDLIVRDQPVQYFQEHIGILPTSEIYIPTLRNYFTELLTHPCFQVDDHAYSAYHIIINCNFTDLFKEVYHSHLANNLPIPNLLSIHRAFFSDRALVHCVIHTPSRLLSLLSLQITVGDKAVLPNSLNIADLPPKNQALYDNYILQFSKHFSASNVALLPDTDNTIYSFRFLRIILDHSSHENLHEWAELVYSFPTEYIPPFLYKLSLEKPELVTELCQALSVYPLFCAEAFKSGYEPILVLCDIPSLIKEHPHLFLA